MTGMAQPTVTATPSSSPVAGGKPVQPVQTAGAKAPSAQEVQDAVKEVQKAVAPLAQELQFTIDKDTGRTVVKVMDTSTNKVVRQIPTEEILEMAKSIGNLQDKFQGLLVQQKA